MIVIAAKLQAILPSEAPKREFINLTPGLC